MDEFYRRYRPKNFSNIIGQPSVVAQLKSFIADDNIPHALGLFGPSGTGKTTTARVLQRQLKCGDMDFEEINAAEARGIDTIRDIGNKMNLSPLGGPCRIWNLDETHQLTKDAQTALLKMLEDTPNHVYFILSSTDPQKLLDTIKTRLTTLVFKPLNRNDLLQVMKRVCEAEEFAPSQTVLDRIIECSDGSARQALVILNQVATAKERDEKSQLDIIMKTDVRTVGIEVARILLKDKFEWSDIGKLLKDIEDDPEKIRYIVLGYARTVMLSGGKLNRCYLILNAFQYNFYDSKAAGLCKACYEVYAGTQLKK